MPNRLAYARNSLVVASMEKFRGHAISYTSQRDLDALRAHASLIDGATQYQEQCWHADQTSHQRSPRSIYPVTLAAY